MRLSPPIWIAAALVVLAPALVDHGHAHAGGDGEPIAVIAVELTGDAAPELRGQLQQSLAKGIAAAGHQPVGLDRVRRAIGDRSELIGCTSTTCLQRIGELVEAQRFLRARVDGVGAAYTIEIELLAARPGSAVERRVEQSCTVCTITELNRMVAETATEVLTARGDEPVPIVIDSEPSGATVHIGGEPLGVTPLAIALAPGAHTVRVTHEGRHAEKRVEVAAGSDGPQRFELVLPPKLSPADDARPYRTWKWVAAGGSAAAVVTGAYLIAIDGDGTCTLEMDQRQCPREYGTLAGGLLTVAVGAGLGATSVYLFLRDRDHGRVDERSPAAAIVPTRGGAMASFGLRF
jgi:hypothetical protein